MNFPNPNELPPPNGLAKIILQTERLPESAGGTMVLIGREDTGQIIGSVQAQTVEFGVGNGLETYNCLNMEYGLEFAKNLCREYLGRQDVDFLATEGTTPVSIAIPGRRM